MARAELLSDMVPCFYKNHNDDQLFSTHARLCNTVNENHRRIVMNEPIKTKQNQLYPELPIKYSVMNVASA